MAQRSTFVSVAAVCALMTSVSAQEVRLSLPADLEDLRAGIQDASLTYGITQDEAPLPQDYVAAARADYRRILTSLYAAGHYGGTVSIKVDGTEAAQISPLTRLSSISAIDISVAPGPKFSFGRASIAPIAEETELPAEFAAGEVAASGVIRDAAKAAVNGWRDDGYAKAGVSAQSIRANHVQQLLDVDIAVDTGPQLTFGDVAVSGNRSIRAARVLNIAGIPTGEVYSPKDIEDAANRLRRTGGFNTVAITEADEIGEGNTLDVAIQVDPAAPRRIGAGAELSTSDGLILNGYWMHRNFLGGAENFRVEGEVSGIGQGGASAIDYRLNFEFLRPQTGPFRTDFYANGALEVINDPGYFLKQVRVEGGFNRLVGDTLTLSAGLGVSSAQVRDDLGTRQYSVVNLPLSAQWERRDVPLDAKQGFYLKTDLMPFVGFGAVDNGLRAYVDGRAYRSFGETQRVTFAARTQLGSLVGVAAQRTPADYLFFSGGGDTVRGQAYQSLSTDLGGGNSIGGLSLATLSLEARVDVTKSLGLVGFYDAGFVGSDTVPLQNGDWHAGTGLGIRYKTGIGPIRLDLATPASGNRFGKELSLYVGIGQAF